MQKYYDLLKKSLTPLIWVNGVLMVVAAVPFIVGGVWVVLTPALFALIMSTLAFPFLMIPAGMCSGVMSLTIRTHPRVATLMQAMSTGYLIFALSMWMALSFFFVDGFFAGWMEWAALLWAVCGGVMSWLVFATNDRSNIFFTVMVMTAEIGGILTALLNGDMGFDFWGRFWCTALIMSVLMTVHFILEELFFKKKEAKS